MVLRGLLIAVLLLIGSGLAAPAAAHKDHEKKVAEQKAAADAAAKRMSGLPSTGMQAAMADHAPQMEAEAPKSWIARSMDWIGRVHPFAVHFPIALFPVAWLALILARRRGDTVDVIRALIIVAGAASTGAALLGWMNAGLAPDRDWIHAWHRWLGTGLGAIGGVVALWAWRRAAAVSSRLMIWTLGLTTLVLLVQGWLGGALIHGVDHLNW
jgi:uncharacterized membrane protein